MTIKKTLQKIVLGCMLALGINGCNNKKYYYDGRIGEEYVKFYGKPSFVGMNVATMEVKRADGTTIKYVDWGEDERLDCIDITKGDETIRYWRNDGRDIIRNDLIGKEVVEEAQKQYDEYLKKIVETKRARGLEDISPHKY